MGSNDGGLDVSERPVRIGSLLSAVDEGATSADDLIVRGDDEDRVEEELRRVHLPILEESGYIEWDRETGEIRKGPNFDEIEPILEALRDEFEE